MIKPQTSNDIFSTLGYLTDQGRVLTTSGAWLRNRGSAPGWDFMPFDSSSLVINSGTLNGFGLAANSTSFTTLSTTQAAFYVCERIGILYNFLPEFFKTVGDHGLNPTRDK